MDVKTILGLTSAIVGAGVVIGQDPSFEYPAVQPVLTSDKTISDVSFDDQQKTITVRFKNASVDEVLDWLTNQGINFVTTGASKDTKVDLNVTNAPIDEVIDAIGNAMGGSFQKRGTTYVFQKGARPFAFSAPSESMHLMPNLQGLPPAMDLVPLKAIDGSLFKTFDMKTPDGHMIKIFGDQDPKSQNEWREFQNELMKEFGPGSDFIKQMQKAQGDPKQREAIAKEMQKRFGPGSAFEKQMKAFGEKNSKKMELYGKSMEKQFGDGSDFAKKMEAFGKSMEKQFGDGSDFAKKMKAFEMKDGKLHEMDPKQREKFMKDLESQMKSLKGQILIPKMDGKAFVMPPMPPMPKMDGKLFAMPKMDGKAFAMPPMDGKAFLMPKIAVQGGDIADVVKTLSASQRDKNKKQGFLYWSDLTKEQQSNIGVRDSSGTWSITYSKDGESFTVKSDPE